MESVSALESKLRCLDQRWKGVFDRIWSDVSRRGRRIHFRDLLTSRSQEYVHSILQSGTGWASKHELYQWCVRCYDGIAANKCLGARHVACSGGTKVRVLARRTIIDAGSTQITKMSALPLSAHPA